MYELQNGRAVGSLNNTQLFNISAPLNSTKGFVGLGTADYGLADFDNLKIDTAEAGLQLMKRKFKYVQRPIPVDKYAEHGVVDDKMYKAEIDIIETETRKIKQLGDIEVIENDVLEETVSGLGDKVNVDRVIEADTLYFKSLRGDLEEEN